MRRGQCRVGWGEKRKIESSWIDGRVREENGRRRGIVAGIITYEAQIL